MEEEKFELNTDLKDIAEKKEKRTIIVRIVIAVFLTAVLVIAILTKDTWFPAISQAFHVGKSADELLGDESPELAKGEFPLRIEGGMGYQLLSMDSALALLDDSKIHIYSEDGKLMNEAQHTYANPILRVSPSKALVYDVGGTMFRVESRYKTIYEKTADDVIYLAEISDKDYTAVVTRSDKYLSQLRIFNDKGDNIFSYFSYDGRITNIAFNKDSSGGVISILTADEGQLRSTFVCFDFKKKDPIWTSNSIPTLAMRIRINSNGTISVIGDTLYALFDANGKMLDSYEYDNTVVDYASAGDVTAVVTENTALRKTELIEFSPGTEPVVTLLEGGANDVYISGDTVYVLSGDTILIFSPDGSAMGRLKLEDQYENICRNGRYIYLLGYDSVNRINFAG